MSRDPENVRMLEQEQPPDRVEEVGEHAFPADPWALARCVHCGCTLEEAERRSACGPK